MYEYENSEKPCCKCKFRDYDSIDDLHLCGHSPLPENLGGWSEIELEGTCEYWELDTFFFGDEKND
jgi:hypothetical protein